MEVVCLILLTMYLVDWINVSRHVIHYAVSEQLDSILKYVLLNSESAVKPEDTLNEDTPVLRTVKTVPNYGL